MGSWIRAGRLVLPVLTAALVVVSTIEGGPAAAQTADKSAAVPPAASVPAGAPHPVEAFATLPFIETPKLSPDGTRFAARIAIDGVQQLVIVDQRGEKSGFRRIAMGENDLNWWRWVNDDWLIAGVGNEVPIDGDDWYVSRVAIVSVDGKTVKLLANDQAGQNADDVIWVAHDGSPIIYLAMQKSVYSDDAGFWPDVERVDISTGKMHQIVAPREGVMDWYADAAGTVRMGVGYDDDRRSSKLYYRATNDKDFRIVSQATSRAGQNLVVPSLFLADPGKALIIDDSDGFSKVKSLDLATLKLGETVFDVPGYDVDDVFPDATGSGLSGVSYIDTRWKMHWVDPGLAQIQADLDKAVGADRWANIVSMSRDHQALIVDVGGPDRMSIYYIYKVADGVMRPLGKVSETYGGRPFSPVRSIRYKARDGLEIEAVLTLPAGKEAKNLPLILMPHGGPHVRDEEEWDWIAQFLADRGYAVIQPNYRGSTGYGNDFAKKGEHQWGLAMQDDLNDAVDWMVAQGMADPKRVCIVGGSYGGYAALRGAQRDGQRFRCAVSFAGVSDLAGLVRYDARDFNATNSTRDYFKNEAPNFAAVSPINFADQFSTPVLLMHGKVDRRVPVKQSRQMADKLRAAGKTFRYVEQPLGDHFFSRQADRLQFLQELEAWLKRYNPA